MVVSKHADSFEMSTDTVQRRDTLHIVMDWAEAI